MYVDHSTAGDRREKMRVRNELYRKSSYEYEESIIEIGGITTVRIETL